MLSILVCFTVNQSHPHSVMLASNPPSLFSSLIRWLEFVLNYANFHLPQHLRGEVPFYNAPAATEAIRLRLGPYLTEADLNGRLVRNLIERWQVFDEERKTYITFQQALNEIAVVEGSGVAKLATA